LVLETQSFNEIGGKERITMKKVLGILLAVFLCLGIASTSMASVETCKGVMIFAGAMLCTDTAAESDAIAVQGNLGTIDGSDYYGCRRYIDYPESNAGISGSATDNSGILTLNNASGNLNNQNNTIAVSNAGVAANGEQEVTNHRRDRGPKGALAHAVAFAFQGNIINGYFSIKKEANATIENSITGNSGIAGVNNAAGSQDNQTNTVAVAIGLDTKIALSEATLAQANALGAVCVTGGINNATITDSINTNSGIVGVNNSAGAQNNQANVVSVAGN
jgi:hypothetical protein